MARLALWSVAVLALGCSLEKSGTAPLDAGADVNRPDVVTDAGDSGVCDPKACEGTLQVCREGRCQNGKSCKDILDTNAAYSKQNNTYPVEGALGQVYCDMTMDGGGWTLVARTAVGGAGSFGWSSKAGSVLSPTAPYVVPANSLNFTEALVAAYNPPTLILGAPVIKLSLPPNFAASTAAGVAVTPEVLVSGGGCSTGDVPKSLTFAGYTAKTTSFFFSDQSSDGSSGVFPDGFRDPLVTSACTTDQMLGTQQILLFVR